MASSRRRGTTQGNQVVLCLQEETEENGDASGGCGAEDGWGLAMIGGGR